MSMEQLRKASRAAGFALAETEVVHPRIIAAHDAEQAVAQTQAIIQTQGVTGRQVTSPATSHYEPNFAKSANVCAERADVSREPAARPDRPGANGQAVAWRIITAPLSLFGSKQTA